MEQPFIVDLTGSPCELEPTVEDAVNRTAERHDQVGTGVGDGAVSLDVFDWSADNEQNDTKEMEEMPIMDELPELGLAFGPRKRNLTNISSSGNGKSPPRVIPKKPGTGQMKHQILQVFQKPEQNSAEDSKGIDVLNHTDGYGSKKRSAGNNLWEPSRQWKRPNTNTVPPSKPDSMLRDHYRANRNPWTRAAPYRYNNDPNAFENEKPLLEQQIHVRVREIDSLKGEQEERLKNLESRRVLIVQQEKEVGIKLNEVEMLKKTLEEKNSLLDHEIEAARQKLNVDRVKLDQDCEDKKLEIGLLRKEFEKEMETQRSTMNAQIDAFEQDMKTRKQQQENERLALESNMQIRKRELDARETIQSSEQEDFQKRVNKCTSLEKKLTDSIRNFRSLRTAKMAELKGLEETVRKENEIVKQRSSDVTNEKDNLQKQMKTWAVARAKQQEDLKTRIRDIECMHRIKLEQLAAQAEAQTRKQCELDSRAAAQTRRTRELRIMRKEIDKTRRNQVVEPISCSIDDLPESIAMSCDTKVNSNNIFCSSAEHVDHEARKPVDYILIDSDDDDEQTKVESTTSGVPMKSGNAQNSGATAPVSPIQRAPAGEPYKFNCEENYNYSLSEETAFELQERLFREAAEKMRACATFQIATPSTTTAAFAITSPMFDIAIRFPLHWTWKDPYSVLGLPPRTSMHLVKSQYRRLAKTYHPDKSGDSNTSAKFHAIASAYHKLVEKP
jgi:DnaJ domain